MKHSEYDRPHWRKESDIVDEIYDDGSFGMPVHYILSLTHECNLHCSFCFLRKVKREASMGVDDWLNILDQLPLYARVIMFGGEPLMFPGFEKVYTAAANKFLCSIVTNGTLLTPDKIDVILSAGKLKDLNVSIDSMNNWNRNFTKKDWSRLVEGIELYNRKRKGHPSSPQLGISVVLLDETADELFEVHKFAHETLNCDFMNYCLLNGASLQLADTVVPFDRLHQDERPPIYQKWDLLLEQLDKIRAYDKKNGFVSYFRPQTSDMNLDEPTESLRFLNRENFSMDRFGVCKMPWADCRILPDGNVTPCLSYSFGNVKKNTNLRNILEGGRSQYFKAQLKKSGFFTQCKRCVFLYDKKFQR